MWWPSSLTTSSDLAVSWMVGEPPTVTIDERCWKCDTRRLHDGCAAGLCEKCCAELRAA